MLFQCDHIEIQKGESENGGGIDQCYTWSPKNLSLSTELFYLYSFPQQNFFSAGGRNLKCPFVQVRIDHCIPISCPPVSCFMSYKEEEKSVKRSGVLLGREESSRFGQLSRLQLKMSRRTFLLTPLRNYVKWGIDSATLPPFIGFVLRNTWFLGPWACRCLGKALTCLQNSALGGFSVQNGGRWIFSSFWDHISLLYFLQDFGQLRADFSPLMYLLPCQGQLVSHQGEVRTKLFRLQF